MRIASLVAGILLISLAGARISIPWADDRPGRTLLSVVVGILMVWMYSRDSLWKQ